MPDSVVNMREWVRQLAASPPSEELLPELRGADEWAITSTLAGVLTGLASQCLPASVLEFGAGRSSLVLASALHRRGGGRLTSIEHQPEYSGTAWRELSNYPSVDAQLVVAPLALRPTWQGPLYVYAGITDALASRGPFGLAVVDAPPGRFGRDWPLYKAAPFLVPGALVVLDDVDRPAETTTLRRWERVLPLERIFEFDGPGRRFAVVRLTSSTAPTFNWRTFLGTCHDRLVARSRTA